MTVQVPGTSLRSRSPAQTTAIARQLMPALGISRVTDITRLDWLGVPVFASVRPRGQTLRVHAGKGMQAADARVGALMEAVELAVAEQAAASSVDARLSVQDLVAQLPGGLGWRDLAPRVDVPPAEPGRLLSAVRCDDLLGGGPVLLPAELVLLPAPEDGPAYFGWSSNGLASGNALDEATLHGLLEVLERDTVAMHRARDESTLLDNTTLPPPFDSWAAQWRRGGVTLLVRHLPNSFGLPCFVAYLHEANSLDVNFASGAGLHVSRQLALARAISEAAQSRLSTIHGGRDDITHFYAKYGRANQQAQQDNEQQLLRLVADASRTAHFDAVPQPTPAATVAEVLQTLLAGLASQQFKHVFRRCMDTADRLLQQHGLHVVKVVVPRCDSVLGTGTRMGPRLLARVLGTA